MLLTLVARRAKWVLESRWADKAAGARPFDKLMICDEHATFCLLSPGDAAADAFAEEVEQGDDN